MSKRGRRPIAPTLPRTRRAAERSQGFLIVGVCAALAVVIVAAAAWGPVSQKVRLSVYQGEAFGDLGASAGSAGCRDPFTLAVTGNTAQTSEGEGIYVSAPPAYGPYSTGSTGTAPTGAIFYDTADRPALTDLVADEYVGYTILWYDTSVSGAGLAQIKAMVRKLDDDADDRDDLIAAPWTKADQASVDRPLAQFPSGTHIAFTHWSAGGVADAATGTQAGVFQYCSRVSGAALKGFMDDYPYTDAPSPGTLPTASS